MDEHDPVDDGEFVFRRIHRTFFDPRVQIPIQFPAFRPNPNDTTGLSVFRARFVQPADTLASLDPAKAKDYYVARLAVRDLRNLGLTVVPEPAPRRPTGACGYSRDELASLPGPEAALETDIGRTRQAGQR
jgi:hypothetical protein